MVTMKEVADLAGVSTATVGRVMNGKGYVSGEAREKVLRALKETDYHPNQFASNLKKKRSNVIAVLVEDLLNPYYSHLVEKMVERGKEIGYIVTLFVVKDRELDSLFDDLLNNRVAAIINLAMFTCDFSKYDVFLEAGVKLIYCTDAPSNLYIDSRNGMRQAFQLFADMGRHDVAFICGIEEWLSKSEERVKIYRESLEEFGFRSSPELIRFDNYPKDDAFDVGFRQCEKLIQEGVKFDALFCMTDLMAVGAMRALGNYGLRIPEDVAVIGYDNILFSRYTNPALTTVNVDKRAEGRGFIDLVTGYAESVFVNTDLVIRESAHL